MLTSFSFLPSSVLCGQAVRPAHIRICRAAHVVHCSMRTLNKYSLSLSITFHSLFTALSGFLAVPPGIIPQALPVTFLLLLKKLELTG